MASSCFHSGQPELMIRTGTKGLKKKDEAGIFEVEKD
jgi:hypothetical protein